MIKAILLALSVAALIVLLLGVSPAQGHTELRFFKSQTELATWQKANLVEDKGDQKCVAEALEMQRRAIRDGYQVSVQAIFYGRWEGVGDGQLYLYRA